MSSGSTPSSGAGMSTDSDECEIPIIYNESEKWVNGLTRRTTCDDVIYALLLNEGKANFNFDVQGYVMFERWRGMERPLRGRTKILKVWKAWGLQRHCVKFYIREVGGDHLDTSCESYKRSSHRREKERHKKRSRKDSRRSSSRSSKENSHDQRDRRDHEDDLYKSRVFQDLVHLILDQERKLKELTERIRDTDEHIESHETKTHLHRVERNGLNYVQDAYLRDRSDASSTASSDGPPVIGDPTAAEMELYINMCDSVLQLQDQIECQERKMGDISQVIHESSINDISLSELNEEQLKREVARLQEQLQECVRQTECQVREFARIDNHLVLCDKDRTEKEREIENLEIALQDTDVTNEVDGLTLSPLSKHNSLRHTVSDVELSQEPNTSRVRVNLDLTPTPNHVSQTETTCLELANEIGRSRVMGLPPPYPGRKKAANGMPWHSERRAESNTQAPILTKSQHISNYTHTTSSEDSLLDVMRSANRDLHDQYPGRLRKCIYDVTNQRLLGMYSGSELKKPSQNSLSQEEFDAITSSQRYSLLGQVKGRGSNQSTHPVFTPQNSDSSLGDSRNSSIGYGSTSSDKQVSPSGGRDYDSNSDTGLSSLHSDETSSPVLETLV